LFVTLLYKFEHKREFSPTRCHPELVSGSNPLEMLSSNEKTEIFTKKQSTNFKMAACEKRQRV